MSIKQVSQLRKDGKYKESLRLAISEYNEEPKNKWLQMSLFWSLHHYCRYVLMENGHKGFAMKCLSEMETLLPTMLDNEGAGEKCYQALRRQLLPYADVVKRCSDMAKTNPKQAYKAYKELSELPLCEIDGSLHEAYGWALFWCLKAMVSSEEKGTKLTKINQLLDTYLKLKCERPSRLHSLVLFYVAIYAKDVLILDFVSFLRSWGQDNFREEDWERRSATGKDGKVYEYKSLAEDCAALCFKLAPLNDKMNGMEWLKVFYKEVVRRYPSDENHMRNYAQLCRWSGETDTAKALYAQLVLQAGNKYYVWQEYADLVEDTNVKIGMLLKALAIETNEDYIGKIHLALAEALIKKRLFSAAASELNTVNSHYQKRGWHIPEKYQALKPLCEGKRNDSEFNRNYYLSVAEESAYSSLPMRYGIVDYVNKEKKTLHIIDADSNLLFHKYRTTTLKAGDYVTFKAIKDAGKERPFMRILTLKRTSRAEALPMFKSCKVVVDNVDETKELFHIAGMEAIRGCNVKFAETGISPKVGDVFDVTYVKRDKGSVKILDMHAHKGDDGRLTRTIEGTLRLKRRGYGSSFNDNNETETLHSLNADFGFVENCYVHKQVLSKHELTDGDKVIAKAVISQDGKWKVYDIKRKN